MCNPNFRPKARVSQNSELGPSSYFMPKNGFPCLIHYAYFCVFFVFFIGPSPEITPGLPTVPFYIIQCNIPYNIIIIGSSNTIHRKLALIMHIS